MEYHIIPHALPGHSDCKTIRIIYNIPPGVQVRPSPMPRSGTWVVPCGACVTPWPCCGPRADLGALGSMMSIRMPWEAWRMPA